MSLISGNRPLLTARVTRDGAVLELTREKVLSLMAKDTEVGEFLMGAFVARRLLAIQLGEGNVVLFGSKSSGRTLALREFLARNGHACKYVDIDVDSCAAELMEKLAVRNGEIPVVYCNRRYVLRNPSIAELAACLDLNINIDKGVRDVLVIGAGPAGLAAAVYAASEGLKTLVIEKSAPGGQAASSSKIENYLGFPTGVSGQELSNRAIAQAQKFGAKMMVAHGVVQLKCSSRPYEVVLDNGTTLAARAIVISTGAQYNKPPLANLKLFEGQGIYYGATYIESQLCEDEEVIVVGGGNSAGQAAVYLSQTARRVHILVRSGQLSDTMSRYLIQRITDNPAIELHYKTEIVGLDGDRQLQRVTWNDRTTRETSTHDIRHVFIMAGASPRTEWLQGCVAMDDKGFILTGRDLDGSTGLVPSSVWPLTRAPQMLETSLPGVFAVGDVRAGNVKRVASAVGEGAISISLVHRALAEF